MIGTCDGGDGLPDEVAATLDSRVAELVRGRATIVVGTALAGATAVVEDLRARGAGPFLVIALTPGTGPAPEALNVIARGPAMHAVADEIRGVQTLVHSPGRDVLAAVERFDPDRRAVVHLNVFAGHDGTVFGRPARGGRPLEFERLEDKTLSRGLWEAAGVPHAAEEVVAARASDLAAAAARLDKGGGTVWSADASDGMNGGADRVHHVVDAASADRAFAALAPICRQVRVMPFLEGVPCSIHALVLPGGIAVLRPVELIVLRSPGRDRFVYAGCATGWDPPASVRESMRSTARAVAQHLADRHGYRGALGIDGIATGDGFRPTELNPRFSGGIGTLAKGLARIPLRWVHDLATLRIGVGIGAAALESAVLAAADRDRTGAVYTTTEAPAPGPATTQVRVDRREGLPDGLLEIGPAAHGRLVRYVPDIVPPGMRLATVAVTAFAVADRLWDTGFGPLAAAPDLRPAGA